MSAPLSNKNPLGAWLELPDGRTHWLDSLCSIGRQDGVTLRLETEPGVSRLHAMIAWVSGETYQLSDTRSTNGTYRNGERISSPVSLRDGDRIRLGQQFEITFRRISTPSAPMTGGGGLTSVQIHQGECWLLDLRLAPPASPNSAASPLTPSVRHLISQVRIFCERHRATVNRYRPNQITVYWREQPGRSEQVLGLLRDLTALQRNDGFGEVTAVLHFGEVRIAGSADGELLSGAEIDFLNYAAELPARARVKLAISGSAASAFGTTGLLRSLGAFFVKGVKIKQEFFAWDESGGRLEAGKERQGLLVVQDSTAMGEGLIRLLNAEPDLRVLRQASSAPQAMQSFESAGPSAVIVDLDFLGGSSLTLLSDLHQRDASVPLLAFMSHADSVLAERAYRAGAVAVVLKTDRPVEVIRAVRTALGGGVHFSMQIGTPVLRRLVAERSEGNAKRGKDSLSDRELEILRLIAVGHPNRLIATALGISVKTVETHKENLKSKLSLESSAELEGFARQWRESQS